MVIVYSIYLTNFIGDGCIIYSSQYLKNQELITMKIGLCGSISVGKTTLAKQLGELDEFKGYEVITERSKYLRDLGIKLNDDSTLKGQIVFAAERSLELMKEDVITDRTVYDVCAFTLSASTISWVDKAKYIDLIISLKDEYDIIIYVSPEGVDIEDNGIRITDSTYRNKIDEAIRAMLVQYRPKKLIEVKGSTENRIETILFNLKS